jgi:two-component system sensor histidine kinase/response regulator
MKHAILCVDDEADNVDALERLFRAKYQVLKATSGQEALKLLDLNRVTVIISDQRMPQMTGVEFLSKSLKSHPEAIRILLTGFADIEVVVEAINSGRIYRYVSKPWDPVDLVNAVDKAVERFELGQELVVKNQRLQEALEELQTLDQAKNQFMVLVNHELKTPLTAMLSFADLLAETKLDEDQQRFLARIKQAAHRLQDMINDALELVSAETQQTKLDLKSLSTPALFSREIITENIQQLATNRHIDFDFQIENQKVIGDERVLRNVLRRLLHNAAKFADKQTRVSVSGRSVPGGLYEVAITNFANSSPKIDDQRVKQLLKPFTLNENSLNHSTGNGLGLSICHALLKLHHSQLRFAAAGDEVHVSFQISLDPEIVSAP